jgi:hypothetical protein
MRRIDTARFKANNHDGVRRWISAVTGLWVVNQYVPENVYNMDQSGFAVGASQLLRALDDIREEYRSKEIGSRQEWVTASECVSAADMAIPPLFVFSAKYTNKG